MNDRRPLDDHAFGAITTILSRIKYNVEIP